jgi:hypothetical protein
MSLKEANEKFAKAYAKDSKKALRNLSRSFRRVLKKYAKLKEEVNRLFV